MGGRVAVEAGRGVWLSERTSGRRMTWVSEGLALDSLCAAGSTGVYRKRRSVGFTRTRSSTAGGWDAFHSSETANQVGNFSEDCC